MDETLIQPGVRGPVLTNNPPAFDAEPVCATCPLAMWFRAASGTRCFCRELRRIVWDKDAEAILACDAREAALIAAADVMG